MPSVTLPPPQVRNHRLSLNRLPEHEVEYVELKDPSIIRTDSGRWEMFASIGNSQFQQWKIGRFTANDLDGVWQELPSVTFDNLTGPQVCAPAVRYESINNQQRYVMYVQSSCFEENCYIALAVSDDGQHFEVAQQPLITKDQLGPFASQVVGVYDAGISQVTVDNQSFHCLTFSGYRRVGCGDIYLTYAKSTDQVPTWAPPQRLLAQEDVPFHNHPDYEWFEWGLEGAQITQLADDSFLMVGVCFTPKPDGYIGTRQRVFFAHARSLLGSFIPLTTPLEPHANEQGLFGENGHPDVILNENALSLIYQERYGDGQPWHLRYAEWSRTELQQWIDDNYQQLMKPGPIPTQPLPSQSTPMHLGT